MKPCLHVRRMLAYITTCSAHVFMLKPSGQRPFSKTQGVNNQAQRQGIFRSSFHSSGLLPHPRPQTLNMPQGPALHLLTGEPGSSYLSHHGLQIGSLIIKKKGPKTNGVRRASTNCFENRLWSYHYNPEPWKSLKNIPTTTCTFTI